MASVSVANARKSYGHFEVLHGVDIDIQDGEFVILVGPSGCGKSTLLRMIAGLEEISAGRISIGSKVVNNVAPKERDIAMVFQSYALYPHLTVEANMGFRSSWRKHPRNRPGNVFERPLKFWGSRICSTDIQKPVGWPTPTCGDGPCHRQKSAGLPV